MARFKGFMKVKLEVWVSITAMVTAVAAVVVAVLQTQVMHEEAAMEREHQRLSVMPAMVVSTATQTRPETASFAVYVNNQGIGPAVIEHMSLSLGGKPVESWAAFVAAGTEGRVLAAGPDRNVSGQAIYTMEPGVLVSAGDHIELYSLNTDRAMSPALAVLSNSLDLRLCYCSLYRECWQASNLQARPQPVKQCPADDRPLFTGETGAQAR